MRFPPEWYQRHETLAHYVPHVRPAQRRGLALWGYGTMLAPSACQNAGITALLAVRAWPGVRECLRDWRYDGQERAAPCQTQLDVPRCFAPRLRWVLAWWQGSALALALDATAHGERVVVLVISGLDRSKASPVA